MNKKVSFDFDNTLSETKVQEYARELINRGIDVYVVTARYDDPHKHLWPTNTSNEDLYAIVNKLGLPLNRIIFCNMQPKYKWFENTDFIFHLDDDHKEIENLWQAKNTNVIPVNYLGCQKGNWKEYCNNLLNQEGESCGICGKESKMYYVENDTKICSKCYNEIK